MGQRLVCTVPHGHYQATTMIAAAALSKTTGSKAVMNSFSGGAQLHASGGFKTQYVFDAPQAGTFSLSAQVATLQECQVLLFAANDSKQPIEAAVPHTVGLWQKTRPIQVALNTGPSTLNVEIKTGSRGVTIQDFTLTPAR